MKRGPAALQKRPNSRAFALSPSRVLVLETLSEKLTTPLFCRSCSTRTCSFRIIFRQIPDPRRSRSILKEYSLERSKTKSLSSSSFSSANKVPRETVAFEHLYPTYAG